MFLDTLSATGADPDHSMGEERWLTFGRSSAGRLVVVSHADDGDTVRIISAVAALPRSGNSMNNKPEPPKDTLRAGYRPSDFPDGLTRGKYAKKAAASNTIVLDPELSAAFPDSASVNDALRALLRVARHVGSHPAERDG